MEKIVVSACLLGENCKYSGGNNLDPRVVEFVRGREVIPVCPEVLAGLGIPRVPFGMVLWYAKTALWWMKRFVPRWRRSWSNCRDSASIVPC